MHSPLRSRTLNRVTTLNDLEEEGQLILYSRKYLDLKGREGTRYFAQHCETGELWEISSLAFKARTE